MFVFHIIHKYDHFKRFVQSRINYYNRINMIFRDVRIRRANSLECQTESGYCMDALTSELLNGTETIFILRTFIWLHVRVQAKNEKVEESGLLTKIKYFPTTVSLVRARRRHREE